MFGAGEAGCFPNLTKIFTIWLPEKERVRAQGIMWLSARWGGAFTPPWWRWSWDGFPRPAPPGVRMAPRFHDLRMPRRRMGGRLLQWYRDSPFDKPKMNAAERELIAKDGFGARACPRPMGRLFRRGRCGCSAGSIFACRTAGIST